MGDSAKSFKAPVGQSLAVCGTRGCLVSNFLIVREQTALVGRDSEDPREITVCQVSLEKTDELVRGECLAEEATQDFRGETGWTVCLVCTSTFPHKEMF